MNKEALVAEVSARVDLSGRAAHEVVDAVLASIARAVARGEKVTVPGFGTFDRVLRAPRAARDPRTGAPVRVPARWAPVFRPAEAFREKVANRTR